MSGQPLRVFVATGNSAPFPRLLGGVAVLAATPRFELFVQRGSAAADFATLPGADFISREEFARRLAWADAVVCHAGAGTLYEAHLAGHIPVVVPREKRHGEHVNDHQLELARALDKRGFAVLCTDPAVLGEALATAPARGPARDVRHRELIAAVAAGLDGSTAPRRRPGLFTVLGDLRRRFRNAAPPRRP